MEGLPCVFCIVGNYSRRRRRMEEKMKINILKDTMAEMPYTEVEKLAQKGAVVREICPEFVGRACLRTWSPPFLRVRKSADGAWARRRTST